MKFYKEDRIFDIEDEWRQKHIGMPLTVSLQKRKDSWMDQLTRLRHT